MKPTKSTVVEALKEEVQAQNDGGRNFIMVSARHFCQEPLDLEEIARITNLSVDEVNAIIASYGYQLEDA